MSAVASAARPRADRSTDGARAGLAMSLATFAMAAASAIQAVLYLGRFGTNARTDGFFVAFALYSTFGVFSQSLRLTSVGLLVEPGARLDVRRFAAVLGAIALPGADPDDPAGGLARAADRARAEGWRAAGDGHRAACAGGGDGAAAVGGGRRDGAGDPRALRRDRRAPTCRAREWGSRRSWPSWASPACRRSAGRWRRCRW